MKDLAIRLSEILYQWVLKAPGHAEYHQVYDNSMTGGHGMMWTFIFLLVISIVAAAIYYFVVSQSVVNATKKNYWTVFGLGLLTLIIATIVGLRLITGYNAPTYWSSNLFMINLVNILWYAILFEVWSLIFMPMSKSTVHALSKN